MSAFWATAVALVTGLASTPLGLFAAVFAAASLVVAAVVVTGGWADRYVERRVAAVLGERMHP